MITVYKYRVWHQCFYILYYSVLIFYVSTYDELGCKPLRFVPDQLVPRTAKTASVCTNSDGTNQKFAIVDENVVKNGVFSSAGCVLVLKYR